MSRQIRQGIKKFEGFDLREFSTVNRGESSYVIRSFASDEEESVQDGFLPSIDDEPATIQTKEDEITEEYYLPPSKLLKAEQGVSGQTVNMLRAQPGSDGFIEHSEFCDVEEQLEDFPKKIIKNESENTIDNAKVIEMQLEIDDLKLKLTESETKISELEIATTEKDELVKSKDDEILNINNSIPELSAKAKSEGDLEGYERGKTECSKSYEAQKEDYLQKIDLFNKESAAKLTEVSALIKSMDEQISEIVVGFVKKIIGTERKVNDKFIVNLINKNLDRLNDLKNVSFVVNPADIDIVKNELSDYSVTPDTSIEKGTVKVVTKVGEVNLDAKIMIADLEKQMDQELSSVKNS